MVLTSCGESMNPAKSLLYFAGHVGVQQHLTVYLSARCQPVFLLEYLYTDEASPLIEGVDFFRQVLPGPMTLSLKVSKKERSPFKC